MNFKDQLKKDLSIFVNSKEFAEECVFDGKTIEAVLDESAYELKKNNQLTESVYQKGVVMNVKATLLERIPEVGENVTLNDSFYTVESVLNEMGLIELTLGGYDS